MPEPDTAPFQDLKNELDEICDQIDDLNATEFANAEDARREFQQALVALTTWKDQATKKLESKLSKESADQLKGAGDLQVVSFGDFATLAQEARRHQTVLAELATRTPPPPPPPPPIDGGKRIGKVPLLAATWMQYLLGFGVSIAVGLAPYLGKIHVPLFEPMLSFIPISLQDIAIPVSSAAMGMVAVAVQWFGSERLSNNWLRVKFRQAVFLCILTLAGLTAIEILAVVRVDVPAVHAHVSFATGFSYPTDPPCEGLGREACIHKLSLDESKINPFFGELGVNLTKLLLVLTYTVFMSTFGFLVGLAVLKGRLSAAPVPEGSAELAAPVPVSGLLSPEETRFKPSDLEKRLRSLRWLGWAAAITVVLVVGGVFVLRSSGKTHKPNPSAISHYERNDHNDRVIVFVHGIFGDALDTWRCASTRMYWPSSILTEDAFKGFDVYVASYESPYFGNRMTIDEIVGNLQNRLQHDKVFDHKEVIIVAHSLGGLIVQRFLLTHREYAKKVPFIYFYSTPETGAEIARLGSLFSSDPLLKDMFPGDTNDYLLNLEAEWKAAGFSNIHRYCAYEKLPTKGVVIVDRLSGTRNCETAVPINQDHAGIVKPCAPQDDSYIALLNVVSSLMAESSSKKAESGQAQNANPSQATEAEGVQTATGEMHPVPVPEIPSCVYGMWKEHSTAGGVEKNFTWKFEEGTSGKGSLKVRRVDGYELTGNYHYDSQQKKWKGMLMYPHQTVDGVWLELADPTNCDVLKTNRSDIYFQRIQVRNTPKAH